MQLANHTQDSLLPQVVTNVPDFIFLHRKQAYYIVVNLWNYFRCLVLIYSCFHSFVEACRWQYGFIQAVRFRDYEDRYGFS